MIPLQCLKRRSLRYFLFKFYPSEVSEAITTMGKCIKRNIFRKEESTQGKSKMHGPCKGGKYWNWTCCCNRKSCWAWNQQQPCWTWSSVEQSQPNKLNDSNTGSILSLINHFSAIDCSGASGNTDRDMYWIIDSRAIDHMTYSQSLFQFMTISLRRVLSLQMKMLFLLVGRDLLLLQLLCHYIICYLFRPWQIIYCQLVRSLDN